MSRKKENINVALLINTVATQSVSNNDEAMLNYIKDTVRAIGLTHTTDAYGNIYVTKGKGPYVALVAHTDTVHAIIPDFKVYKHGNTLFGFNGITGRQYGTGGDDKVGVFCNLQALIDLRNVKVAFFRNEEIGCLGSGNANMEFFKDCNFVVQFDRRGNSDLITEVGTTPLCSDDFIKALKPYTDAIGYKKTTGLSTDVATLKRKGLSVSAINLSCGYHDPHTSNEIIRIDEVDRIYSTIRRFIITNGHIKYPHVYVAPKYTPSSNSRDYNYGNYGDDDIYNGRHSQCRIPFNNFNKYKDMIPLQRYNPKTYRYVGNEVVDIESECPVCKEKSQICFLPKEVEFYCTECNKYIPNPEKLFKEVELKFNDDTFVFSWVNVQWMKKSDSIWVTNLYTYELKERISQ